LIDFFFSLGLDHEESINLTLGLFKQENVGSINNSFFPLTDEERAILGITL